MSIREADSVTETKSKNDGNDDKKVPAKKKNLPKTFQVGYYKEGTCFFRCYFCDKLAENFVAMSYKDNEHPFSMRHLCRVHFIKTEQACLNKHGRVQPDIEYANPTDIVFCHVATSSEPCSYKTCLGITNRAFSNVDYPSDEYFLCDFHEAALQKEKNKEFLCGSDDHLAKHPEDASKAVSAAVESKATGAVAESEGNGEQSASNPKGGDKPPESKKDPQARNNVMPEVSLSESQKEDYRNNRLYQTTKSRKKDDHWVGIHLVVDDAHIHLPQDSLKAVHAQCAYCELCDTFFPYHNKRNSKAVLTHKKNWCTGAPPMVAATKVPPTCPPRTSRREVAGPRRTPRLPTRTTQELETMTNDLSNAKKDAKRLGESIQRYETETKHLKEMIRILENDKNKLELSNKNHEAVIKMSNMEVERLRNKLLKSEGHLETSKLSLSELQTGFDDMQKLLDTANVDINDLKRRLAEKDELCEELKRDAKRSKTDLKDANDMISHKTSQIQRLEQEVLNAQAFNQQQQENLQNLRALLTEQTSTSRRRERTSRSNRSRRRRSRSRSSSSDRSRR
jgi:DNA repair exonuclease SbcCD ATPase subunit